MSMIKIEDLSGADNRTCKDERSKDGIAERCDASRIRTVMMWDKRGNEPKKQKIRGGATASYF